MEEIWGAELDIRLDAGFLWGIDPIDQAEGVVILKNETKDNRKDAKTTVSGLSLFIE